VPYNWTSIWFISSIRISFHKRRSSSFLARSSNLWSTIWSKN